MSYFLIGERPTVAVENRRDLWLRPDRTSRPHSANRLMAFAGYSLRTYLRVFSIRSNVVTTSGPDWGPAEKSQARNRGETARWFVHSRPNLLGIVALGRRAATACGYTSRGEPLQWQTGADGVQVAYVPHTSGMCRWWNDGDNVEAAFQFFQTLLTYAEMSESTR